MYKSFFFVWYGGCLFFVIDVMMKDGDVMVLRWEVNLGLINFSLLLEGLFVEDKGIFLFVGWFVYLGVFILVILFGYLSG